MWETTRRLNSEEDTRRLGAGLGAALARGDVVALSGPLGAGKTLLARAAIAARTNEKNAPSPTFGLVNQYPAADEAAAGTARENDDLVIWHFDLYRLEKASDADELGLEDAFETGAALIEWAERIADRLPPSTLLVRLAPPVVETSAEPPESAASERNLVLRSAASDWAERLAPALSGLPPTEG